MTFRYSLASDLHVDTGHESRVTTMPWLSNIILAGDTCNGLENLGIIQKFQRRGHQVFAVPGNHEHYRGSGDLVATERSFYEKLGLSQRVEVVPCLTILGCNGWYVVDDPYHWQNYMSDARYVDAEQVNDAAFAQSAWLGDELDKLEGRAIVVTHTAPCMETLDPRYEGSAGNPYFFNPLMVWVMKAYADKIAVWHHGHTHTGMDKTVHGVRIVSNPRGYPGENPNWAPIEMEI